MLFHQKSARSDSVHRRLKVKFENFASWLEQIFTEALSSNSFLSFRYWIAMPNPDRAQLSWSIDRKSNHCLAYSEQSYTADLYQSLIHLASCLFWIRSYLQVIKRENGSNLDETFSWSQLQGPLSSSATQASWLSQHAWSKLLLWLIFVFLVEHSFATNFLQLVALCSLLSWSKPLEAFNVALLVLSRFSAPHWSQPDREPSPSLVSSPQWALPVSC